jgi:hypothetical protein
MPVANLETEDRGAKTIARVEVAELADLQPLTSAIQDAKRRAIQGKSSRWPHQMEREFAPLEAASASNPYAALDLKYLRDEGHANRSFAYVLTYDRFMSPRRDASGGPEGEPELLSLVKFGDGGRDDGLGAGAASGSIISRMVRYWIEGNVYRPVLHGVVIPGNDTGVSRKLAAKLGDWGLRVRGDEWRRELLDRLSVEELLALMEARPARGSSDR